MQLCNIHEYNWPKCSLAQPLWTSYPTRELLFDAGSSSRSLLTCIGQGSIRGTSLYQLRSVVLPDHVRNAGDEADNGWHLHQRGGKS